MTLPQGTEDLMQGLTDSQRMNLKVLQNIASVNTAVNNLQDDYRELKTEVEVLTKLLITGNGVPSLQERMRNLESYTSNQKYWLRVIGAALVVQTITFGASALVYFLRIAPVLESLSNIP